MYYIGYDLGSSFVKIALLDYKKNKQVSLIKEPTFEMEIISLKDDWAEQDPKLWWKYICNGTKKIINKTKINKDGEQAVRDYAEKLDGWTGDILLSASDIEEITEKSSENNVDYNSMTVAELKELLKEAGKPVSGKKADLIARLNE